MKNNILVLCLVGFLLVASGFAGSQDYSPPSFVVHPNLEIRVGDLPVRKAISTDSSSVLSATLETIFHDSDVCCGKNSALEDTVLSADTLSLKDLGEKLAGRHVLSDGRPVIVKAEYLSPNIINPARIIEALGNQQALAMMWNSRLYVLYGAVFDEQLYDSGRRDFVIP